MPLTEEHIRIAAFMLGLENCADLPEDLAGRLNEIERLARKAGGRLRSRQAIAAAIEAWRRETGRSVTLPGGTIELSMFDGVSGTWVLTERALRPGETKGEAREAARLENRERRKRYIEAKAAEEKGVPGGE